MARDEKQEQTAPGQPFVAEIEPVEPVVVEPTVAYVTPAKEGKTVIVDPVTPIFDVDAEPKKGDEKSSKSRKSE